MASNKFILIILTVMTTIILEQNLGTIMVVGMPYAAEMPPQSSDDVKIEKVTPPPNFQDLRRFSAQKGGLNP
ncbi:hypothetical protein LSTR_LSTR002137 [Laodelphax striatellus]|uniref:Uncharacterized protein n=1 Tax=Laodelphax striatellus TaxID=195883 RepID=A0A482XT08_LAOST|nr:hypothetical protein LSTR_LSTR002137 [Laodelphax striatellus]